MRFAFAVLLLLGAGSLACGGETDPSEPDLTPPSVVLVDPTGGATVTGVVPLAATAEDSSGIAGVTFRVDGVAITAEDQVAPFAINWPSATVSDGVHLLTAVARDSAGNSTTSVEVSVTVDNTAPTVAVSSPGAGSKVAGTVALAATASDLSGVAGVTFRVDGVAVGSEDLVAPYTVDWNTGLATEGVHVVAAVARDSAGKTKTSAGVAVTVDNIPLGTLRVTLDAEGYVGLLTNLHVIIDSGATGPVRPVGSFPIDSLVSPGPHTVTLSGLPAGCTLDGAETRGTTVVTDSVVMVDFDVECGYANVLAVGTWNSGTGVNYLDLVSPAGTIVRSLAVDSTRMVVSVAIRPDGRGVAYANWNSPAQDPVLRYHDLITGADSALGGNRVRLADGTITWAPDGSALVFSDSGSSLQILTWATGGVAPVANGENVRSVAWSPLGDELAFTAARDTALTVYRMTTTGVGLTAVNLPPPGDADEEVTWSPDGSKLYFTSTRAGEAYVIWRMDPDGGDAEQITTGSGLTSDKNPALSPAGTVLAFTRNNGVVLRTLSSGAEAGLGGRAGSVTALDWSR